MSLTRHATLGVLLAAAAAAPALPARNFANVAKEWTLVGSSGETALFVLLSPGDTTVPRSLSVALYFVQVSKEPKARPYRRATGTATVDCSKRLFGMKFTRATRPDGHTDDIVLAEDPLAPVAGDETLGGRVFALACGKLKPSAEKLASLRAWEGGVANALREQGVAVRDDDELVERCAVLVEGTDPDPSSGLFQHDAFVTQELTFKSVHPGQGFAAYVQGKTGAPAQGMVCDLLDADRPETEREFLGRIFGSGGLDARVVDNSWRPR